MLALDSAAVVLLVFDVVVGRGTALLAAGAVLLFVLTLWGGVALVERAAGREGGSTRAAQPRRSGSTSAP
jgi:hypothetical protein